VPAAFVAAAFPMRLREQGGRLARAKHVLGVTQVPTRLLTVIGVATSEHRTVLECWQRARTDACHM